MKQVLNSIKNKINPVSAKQKSNSQHNQKDPNSKVSYSEVAKKNSQDLKMAPIQKNDKTFDSHANSSNQHGKQDTSSESMKSNLLPMNDGPIQLARSPYDQDPLDNDQNKDNSSVPPPPHRYWEKEPQQVINNLNNNCLGTTSDQASSMGPGISVWDNQTRQSGSHGRKASPQRPNKISKMSYQLASTDGDEVIEHKSVYHDDVLVFHSIDHKKKIKRLEYLEGKGAKSLESMERKTAYRFVLTKCHPGMDEEDVELYLHKNFRSIKDLYVRKTEMKKHNDYSTFVFIVNSRDNFDIDEVTYHDFPGNIVCFFTPNNDKKRY